MPSNSSASASPSALQEAYPELQPPNQPQVGCLHELPKVACLGPPVCDVPPTWWDTGKYQLHTSIFVLICSLPNPQPKAAWLILLFHPWVENTRVGAQSLSQDHTTQPAGKPPNLTVWPESWQSFQNPPVPFLLHAGASHVPFHPTLLMFSGNGAGFSYILSAWWCTKLPESPLTGSTARSVSPPLLQPWVSVPTCTWIQSGGSHLLLHPFPICSIKQWQHVRTPKSHVSLLCVMKDQRKGARKGRRGKKENGQERK